ncbi:MAG: class I SAM-dependent methyltransferase [Syntrophaceae bacterium]|nr:class I SAM-dependent methyltransferase [Syntrophaceae bacterium]
MIKNQLMRPCPVCRNEVGAERLHTQEFVLPENHPLPAAYDVVACGRCGFVYADTPAGQDAYDRYYADMSRYDMNYTCPESSLYADRAAWIDSFIRDRTDSIIDIGCGNGLLLLELQKRGLSDLTGLDPSEACVSALRKKGIPGTISSIFSVSTDRAYDGAVLSGVLEHICDVGGVMDTAKRLLKHGGQLFVCVPDASRYRFFDAVPFDYFNIEHINHFEETSLINLGLQHGFHMSTFLKTTITLARTTQPMIFCVYENAGQTAGDMRSYARNAVVHYIEQTKKRAGIHRVLDELAETGEEVIVWGAGNYTSRLLADSSLGRCNIVLIVDNDPHKQGTRIGGRAVHSPQAILDAGMTRTILIAAAVFGDEIAAEIRHMGLQNKIISLGNSGERSA